MNLQTIKQQLNFLKLNTASNEIDQVLQAQKKSICLSWLGELLERELDSRKEKAIEKRIKKAKFPEITTIESFDFNFNKSINKQKILNLASLEFIKNNQIALFLGEPGTGKTHIALALGVLAAKDGYRVYCTSVKRLSKDIINARAKHSLDILFKRILSCKLWILDDWGVISMDRDVAEEVFDLLDRRKQASALILTSNRAVEEWADIFPDPVLASATIDRLFDRAEILTSQGDSYRLKGRIRSEVVDSSLID
jgi:DNA replication protein DnaC